MDNNNKNDSRLTSLPNLANDVMPEAKPDAKEIVGLVKKSGKISGYKLSSGQIVNTEQGVSMAKSGDIKGVAVAHKKDTEYLRSFADGNDQNNLDNLPSVTQ